MSIDNSNEETYVIDLTTWGDLTPTLPINGPFSWTGNDHQAVSTPIKYSFDVSNAFYSGHTLIDSQTPTALDVGDQILVEKALARWHEICGVSFTPDDSSPNLVFGKVQLDTPYGSGTEGAMFPKTIQNTSDLDQADLYLDSDLILDASASYRYETILHEIGHSLGLSHPEGGNGSSANYNRDLTIMSTNPGTFVDGAYGGSGITAVTPMIYDIAAAQFLYGANTTHNANATEYAISDTYAEGIAITDSGGNLTITGGAMTIWDGGDDTDPAKQDTIKVASDALNVAGAQIDLRAGFASSDDTVGGYYSEGDQFFTKVGDVIVFNAYANGTHGVIENAIGGNQSDKIFGNSADNNLQGGAGNDTIYGFVGNDTLYGGTGNDTLVGGVDHDIYGFAVGDGEDTIIDDSVGSGHLRFIVDGGQVIDVITGLSGTSAGTAIHLAQETGIDTDVYVMWKGGEKFTFTRDGDDLLVDIGSTTDNTKTIAIALAAYCGMSATNANFSYAG